MLPHMTVKNLSTALMPRVSVHPDSLAGEVFRPYQSTRRHRDAASGCASSAWTLLF